VRVAFVINSLGSGGTERSTAVLLPYLRDRGIEPVVFCLHHRCEGDEQSVLDAGFDVRFVKGRGLSRVFALRAALQELRPAIIHTAIFEADVGTRIPVISSLVNTPYAAARLTDPNISRWKLAIARTIDSWTGRLLTTRFHAVTQGVADEAVSSLRLPRRKITVVERGRDDKELGRPDPRRRSKVRGAEGWRDEEIVVVAAGRQEFQKGHVHLVDAIHRLVSVYPQMIAVIAGRRGNASDDIEARIAQHGLADQVRLLGYRDDVADLLVGADVFVMPSLYEGTAGAAIEALALEVPIVASDLAGTRDVLNDGANATLVEIGDATALADAIALVIENPIEASARAARGRQDFEERFTIEESADRMVAFYRDVADQGRRHRSRPPS